MALCINIAFRNFGSYRKKANRSNKPAELIHLRFKPEHRPRKRNWRKNRRPRRPEFLDLSLTRNNGLGPRLLSWCGEKFLLQLLGVHHKQQPDHYSHNPTSGRISQRERDLGKSGIVTKCGAKMDRNYALPTDARRDEVTQKNGRGKPRIGLFPSKSLLKWRVA